MPSIFDDLDIARRIRACGTSPPDARELTRRDAQRAAQEARDAQKVVETAREAADSMQRSLERGRAAGRSRSKSHASADQIIARMTANRRGRRLPN